MAEQQQIDALDRAISALLTGGAASAAAVAKEPPQLSVAALVKIARELQHVPRAAFRARLRQELTEEAMTRSVQAAAEVQSVVPYIAVRRAEELMDFIREAFGAEGGAHGVGSQGGLHAEFTLNGSRLMIGGGKNWNVSNPERPTALHYYVRDVDEVYRRAIEAGARDVHALAGMPAGPAERHYGDREAGIRDVAGNYWFLATHLATGYAPRGVPPLLPTLFPRSSRELIAFLHDAMGAEEISMVEGGGLVIHAQIKIGQSVIEMGDARGPWQPMPTTFFVNVSDVDAIYERALAAGAEIMSPPADAPHGSRIAAIRDPERNEWYFAAPIAH